MTYSEVFAKRILDICKERNITVNKLAMLSGLHYATIDNIIKGNSKSPEAQTLHRIAHGLGMTIIEFYDFPEAIEFHFEED